MSEEEIKEAEVIEKKQEDKVSVQSEPKKVKKHRVWPWVLGVFIILLAIPIIAFAYFGLVPGISGIFGFNKPKDLGVKYTPADYTSYQQKTGAKFLDFANAPDNPAKPGKKIVFTDPKQMDVNLTQEELTAAINSTGWLWMPIKNAQVRLGNGTLEVSGNVNSAYIPNFVNFIGGVGYSQRDVDMASGWAKKFGNPPIYIKANASVTNNVLSLNVTQAQVGKFNIPVNIANKVLNNGTGSVKTQATSEGYEVKTVVINNGQMYFVGTSPTTIYVKKN